MPKFNVQVQVVSVKTIKGIVAENKEAAEIKALERSPSYIDAVAEFVSADDNRK